MTDMSWEHADEARAALNAIVTDPEHGAAALSSPQMMSNLLKDLLPDAPREKGLLVAAAEAGLANTLRDHVAQGMDPDTATRLAASSLAVSTPFTPEACNWVTSELAIALGISQPRDSGAQAAGAAGTGYSAGDAPTQGWARPSPDSYGQAPAQGYGQAPSQGSGQAPAQGYGQAPVQSNPQGGFGSDPQGGSGSSPQGGAQSFQKAGYQGNPQGGGQSFPQAGYQSNPQGGGQFLQAGYQSNPQGGIQSNPQVVGPAFQQPVAPGFGQGAMPGFQVQPGSSGPKNNSLAIAALICGCAQFVLWFLILIPGFLAAIAALVLGLISQRQIATRGEAGRGMAITGIILGALGVLGGIVWIVIFAVAAKSPNYGGY